MVHFMQSWFQPAIPHGQHGRSPSSCDNTIVALALGALALFTANAFDRTNPGLAVILRCAAGGFGLIWLFSRCCPTTTRHHHIHHPVVHAPVPVVGNPMQPRVHSRWTWWPSWSSTPPMYAAPVHRIHQYVVQPLVSNPHHPPQQAHTNYSHVGLHQGAFPKVNPHHGNGFPTVHRANAQPDLHAMNPAAFNRGSINGTFPNVRAVDQSMFQAAKDR